MDALRRRGWSRFTRHSIVSMVLGLVGAAYILGWGSTQLFAVAANGIDHWPIFVSMLAFWSIYPAVLVRHLGWKAMLVEALILPEALYTVVRTYWLVSSLLKSFFTRVSVWH